MRFLFIVQGEGRGHMTQAISMRDMLVKNGHEVAEVLVGKSKVREIPQFFYDKIKTQVHTYESPNFQMTHNRKGIQVYRSIVFNAMRSRTYFRSISFIRQKIREHKPDVVLNFYEMLTGVTWFLYRPKVRYICVGHQFLLLHPEFVFPAGHKSQILMLNFLTRLTGYRAEKWLSLSFVPMTDLPKKKLYVVPPILRHEVMEITPENKGYILGYMLNSGYGDEIVRWHKNHPDLEVHFFWDKKDAPEDLEVEPNLFFHRISDVKFLHYMKDCMALSSTSGFESVCEAMYMRKPVLMVPTAGHIEQRCNSVDAVRAGAGIACESFELDKLLEFIPKYNKDDRRFIDWVNQAETKFIQLLTKQ